MTVQHSPLSVHAFSDDALGYDDATGLAERILRGEITATEVAQATLARAQKVDPRIHAIASLDDTLSVTPTESLPPGPFSGVPTFIKDNTDVKGLPSGHGSAAVTPQVSPKHSPFTSQLLAQGFCVLGKSRLPEFGFNASVEPPHAPPARNPWNLEYSTGASSGGAAALVAAGVVPIAHANDGGGSIRIPAACCGLVGLKPTRGRLIDNEAAKSLPVNIMAEGIVTRSVRDTANFYAAAEQFFYNHKLPAIGQVSHPGKKRLRIGLVIDSITGNPTDADTRKTVEATAQLLQSLGHKVDFMQAPINSTFPEDFALYWGMLAFAMKSAGTRLIQPEFDKTRLDELTLGLARMFKRQCYRIPLTLWRLKRSQQDYAKAIAGYDAVLTPVLGHTTPRLGHLSPDVGFDEIFERLTHYVNFTPLANATGAPALSLPMGTTSDHLPASVQLMAPHGHERTLLELAFELEEAAPWRHLYH